MGLYLEKIDFLNEIHFKTFKEVGINTIGPHCHPQIEIICSTKGKTRVGIGNEIIELEENEIVYFPPGQTHYFLYSPGSTRLVFLFDIQILDSAKFQQMMNASLFDFLARGEICSRNWPEKLTKKVRAILEEMNTKLEGMNRDFTIAESFYLLGMISILMAELIENLPIKTEDKESLTSLRYQKSLEQLNEVTTYVQNNYADSIKLKDVADHIGFNQFYFTKFFKKLTGKTFMTFLEDYRIQQARYILSTEQIPMTEVSERVGFESVKTFHHVFKKKVGISPLQYQKKVLTKNEILES